VHDGITFERLGIPSAVIITEPFIPAAEAISDLDGLPGYESIAIPHPVTSLTTQQLAERARDAAGLVEAILLGAIHGESEETDATGQLSREAVSQVLEPYRVGLQSDGADLIVDAVGDDDVSVRLVFSDETCTDCIMPSATVRDVLSSMLSRHYDRIVTVDLDDPRDAAPEPSPGRADADHPH